jgi:hypothetical protein
MNARHCVSKPSDEPAASFKDVLDAVSPAIVAAVITTFVKA